MHKTVKPGFLGALIFLFWLHLTIIMFLLVPGRYTYLQYAQMFVWQYLPLALAQINVLDILVRQFAALFFILVFMAVCISLGIGILQLLKFVWDYKISKLIDLLVLIVTALLVGQGVLAAIFIFIGSIGSLTPMVVSLILVISFLLGFWSIINVFKSVPWQAMEVNFRSFSGSEKLFIGMSIFIVAIAMLLTTSRLSYDAVAVYFSDAKFTALLHRIVIFRQGNFIVSNFQTGIIYSILIQIFNDQAARMLSWVGGCVILIFSIAIADQLGLSRRAKIILVTLLLSTTAFIDLWGDGKVELQSTSFAIGTVYWLIVSWKSSSRPLSTLTGILAGLAMIARSYNIPLLACFFMLYIGFQLIIQRKDNPILSAQNFTFLFLLGIGITFWGGYYLFANWLLLGNPLAPLQASQNISSQNWQWAFDKNYIWLVRLLYPFVITFINSPQSLGNISPLFLGFLPAIFIKDIRQKIEFPKPLSPLFWTATIVIILWVISIFTVVEIRYVLFLWIILYMPVSVIIASIKDTNHLQLRKITEIIIFIVLAYTALRVIKITIDTYAPIDRNGNAHCYGLPYCDLELEINKVASPGDRVLTLNAYRYYLTPPLLSCSTGPDEYINLKNVSSDTTEFWAEVYRQGYKYIAYEENYSTRHLRIETEPSPDNTPSWMTLNTIFASDSGGERVYEIQANNPKINILKTCQQNEQGNWEVHDSKIEE